MNEEEFAAFWRGSQEVFRALVFQGRPPGTGATVVGFSGRDESGKLIELRREGDGFLLHPPGQRDKAVRLTVEELIPRLGGGSLVLETLTVVPEVAEAIFPHAVREAEGALRRYREATEHAAGLGKEGDGREPDPFGFAMWGIALDRTIPSSISAIVLAVATAEAQVNKWMAMLGVKEPNDAKSDDKGLRPPKIVPKLRALATAKGTEIGVDVPPWSDLRALVQRRNELVHSTASEQPVALMQTGREELPGYGWTLEARRACWTVRSALVAMADIMGTERPSYLAYCPPGDPADDDAWRTASIMTGARDDPDFPRAGRTSGSE